MLLIAPGANLDHELKNGHSILTDATEREQEHAMQWFIWLGVDRRLQDWHPDAHCQ